MDGPTLKKQEKTSVSSIRIIFRTLKLNIREKIFSNVLDLKTLSHLDSSHSFISDTQLLVFLPAKLLPDFETFSPFLPILEALPTSPLT